MFDGKTVCFFVRGIAGHPSDFLEWEQRAADYVHINTPHKARAIAYATSFLTVWKRRRWRALRFSRVLRNYTVHDWRVSLTGHSEGTVVALDALRLAGWPRIETLHLICGACNSDFDSNGLNWALAGGAIGSVHVYIAGKDKAMLWENLVLGKLLFGIPERSKPLGLNGPRNVHAKVQSKVIVHRESPWDNYGHSTCLDKGKFDSTLRQILQGH